MQVTKEFDERNAAKSRAKCAEMSEAANTGKRVLTERERQILDMWPRFEDSEYVWFGDAVNGVDARSFVFVENEAMVTNLTSVPAYGECRRYGEPFMRPAPKDSWERLEEDAGKGVCEYAGAMLCGDIDAHDCETCRFYKEHGGMQCEQQRSIDIIRRAKALAGVEVDE